MNLLLNKIKIRKNYRILKSGLYSNNCRLHGLYSVRLTCRHFYAPPNRSGGGGGHIVFGVDPVRVRVASFPHVIF